MSSDSSQPESSNFDNDFEKLDPLTSQMDDLVTSTSEVQGDMAEADLYSRPPASEVEPLVNLMEEPAPPARHPDPQPLQPDSSSPSKPAATEGKTCCAGTWMKQVDPRDVLANLMATENSMATETNPPCVSTVTVPTDPEGEVTPVETPGDQMVWVGDKGEMEEGSDQGVEVQEAAAEPHQPVSPAPYFAPPPQPEEVHLQASLTPQGNHSSQFGSQGQRIIDQGSTRSSEGPPPSIAAEGPTTPPMTFCTLVDTEQLIELIYWRDVKKSGIVFGSMMVLLLSLALFSVLSVVSYLSLGVLTITISFVIYKKVIGAVQKSSDGHPFKEYLDLNIALPEDKARELADLIIGHVSCCLRELRRLFLIEDMVDSLKFGLMLWVLTYVGAWFNGMTLIILATVKLFTLPKVYEMHQEQIDHYIDLAKVQTKAILKQVQEKLPLPGKKKQT